MSGRVVILGGDCEATRIVYNALRRRYTIAKVIIEAPVPRRQLISKRIKKLGMLRVVGQLLFIFTISRWLTRTSRKRVAEILASAGLDCTEIPEEHAVHVDSVNGEEANRLLRNLQPDVVLVSGTRIISKGTLEWASSTFVNMHSGITPLYRGVHGAYWALTERDAASCGVTVHLVDPGIDTGGILAQAVINPTAQDNFATYPALQLAAGIPLLAKVVEDILSGRVETKPPPSGQSRLWSHPTLLQYLWYRITRGVK